MLADVFGIEKCRRGFIRQMLSMVILQQCFPQHKMWELKNFIRRWWRAHDDPEYGWKIIRGTMERMKKVAHANGYPISSYYSVG